MTPSQFIYEATQFLEKNYRASRKRLNAGKPGYGDKVFSDLLHLLRGQPNRKKHCYEKNGKLFMKSYNGLARTPDGEFYDAYHLWCLGGGFLAYQGGTHRL